MVYSVYTKNPKLTRDRAVLEKIFFRLDFAAKTALHICEKTSLCKTLRT